MEENKKNDQLDDELDVELDEEEDTEVEDDGEEYDFGDSDEENVDSDEAEDGSAEDGAQDTVPEEDSEGDEEPKKPDEISERARTMMADMLDRLGYQGTYEEKLAAYEADAAGTKAEKTEDAAPPTDEKTEAPVDYKAMAEKDLRDINAAFGTQFSDFSGFRDVERFAFLRTHGATALEAYRATQEPMAEAKGDGKALSKPSISHIQPLPRGGQEGSSLSSEDKRILAQLRELYPELSTKELKKKLDKVRRNR